MRLRNEAWIDRALRVVLRAALALGTGAYDVARSPAAAQVRPPELPAVGGRWTLLGSPGSGAIHALVPSPRFPEDPFIVALQDDKSDLWPVRALSVVTSVDGGVTWQRAPLAGTDQLPLVAATADGVVVFATEGTLDVTGATTPMLYRSGDRGVSWQLVRPLYMTTLELSPSFASDGIAFAADASTLYRSTDWGVTWEPVLDQPGDLLYAPGFAANGTVLLARSGTSTAAARLLRSVDYGRTWEALDVSRDLRPSGGGIPSIRPWFSPDFGRDATIVVQIQRLARVPGPVVVFESRTVGLAVSHDGGSTWSVSDPVMEMGGVRFTSILDLRFSTTFADHRVVEAVALRRNAGPDCGDAAVVFSSSDGLVSWQPVAESAGCIGSGAALPALFEDGTVLTRRLVTGSGSVSSCGVSVTTDWGRTWRRYPSGGAYPQWTFGVPGAAAAPRGFCRLSILSAPAGPAPLLVTQGHAAVSWDAGESWRAIQPPDPAQGAVSEVVGSPAFARDPAMLVATQTGAVWQLQAAPDG